MPKGVYDRKKARKNITAGLVLDKPTKKQSAVPYATRSVRTMKKFQVIVETMVELDAFDAISAQRQAMDLLSQSDFNTKMFTKVRRIE